MERSQKENIVSEIKDSFKGVMSIVLADYRGVDVPTITAMRDEFRESNCHYRVLKNTLVKLAVKGSDVEPISAFLEGPTAIMWSYESPTEPAKIAAKIAKVEKCFQIKGGYVDGNVIDELGVQQLASMPGKQELQAMLLMTFMAPATDFVRLMAAGPTNFLYVLGARKRALGGE